MFQERIRIRRATPKHARIGIWRRSHHAGGKRLDGRQRTPVAVAIKRAPMDTLKKRCKSATSYRSHATPMRYPA
ncbi:TPA: hypothetical protein ACUNF5_003027 [Burkholderia orbicola]|uniref:hypothetical protein n=1 Tax=Burkholderia orbicola TaxID=2978683 RepID=UPI001906FC08|nr:hypothetical protein [Burkholderia orbicola]MBK1819145.1 hypothetical protein [Burkholderia orbicola]